MAQYAELFGLPGSGKSSVCRSFNNFSGSRNTAIRSSPARGNLALNLGRPLGGSLGVRKGLTFKEWLRDDFTEGMLFSAQVHFPKLFAHVLIALSEIDDQKVSRQLLNYWKIRVSEYQQIERTSTASVLLKDEGLVQTAFSTLLRLPSNSSLLSVGQEYISDFLSSMPKGRVVVFLDVPLDVAALRCQHGKGQVPPTLTPETQKVLSLLRDALDESGVELVNIDATFTIREVHNQILSRLNPVIAQ